MSIEAHPNFHAVAFATDVVNSLGKNLRGNATGCEKKIFNSEKLKHMVVDFAVNISTEIDTIVEEK